MCKVQKKNEIIFFDYEQVKIASSKLFKKNVKTYDAGQLEHPGNGPQVGGVKPDVGLDLGFGHRSPGCCLSCGVIFHFDSRCMSSGKQLFENFLK